MGRRPEGMNDRAVMERLAADNMGLAYSVANKY